MQRVSAQIANRNRWLRRWSQEHIPLCLGSKRPDVSLKQLMEVNRQLILESKKLLSRLKASGSGCTAKELQSPMNI